MDELQKYGIGGVVAMTLLKLIDYLNNKRTSSNECGQLLKVMEGLEDAIKSQTTAIKEQTKAVTTLYTEAKLNSQAIDRVARDTSDIRSNCPRFSSK